MDDDRYLWHVLALRFGCTIGELQARMTGNEFAEWAEFYELCPFDDFHLHVLPQALSIHIASGEKLDKVLDILQSRKKESPSPETIDASVLLMLGGDLERNS